MADAKPRCAGFRRSGYRKGYPCGAAATVSRHGAWWCRNHLPVDDAEAAEVLAERRAWHARVAERHPEVVAKWSADVVPVWAPVE